MQPFTVVGLVVGTKLNMFDLILFYSVKVYPIITYGNMSVSWSLLLSAWIDMAIASRAGYCRR